MGANFDGAERPLFLHFPHYTNQGSHPTGAMRDGECLLIEHYDTDRIERYNLSADIGERNDRSAQVPQRKSEMLAALDAWRQESDVQYNRPIPDCDEDGFKRFYLDFDPGSFDPANTDEVEWACIAEWRRQTNGVNLLV